MRIPRVLALLLLPLSASSQQNIRTCKISVVDSEGAVIGRAHIFAHRDPVASAAVPDKILDANNLGHAELNLPTGIYDVCVMSAAFTPQCRKVVLREKDADVRFRLSAANEVLEQSGDSFPTQ
jgi:hypothetical protein